MIIPKHYFANENIFLQIINCINMQSDTSDSCGMEGFSCLKGERNLDCMCVVGYVMILLKNMFLRIDQYVAM